MNKRIVTRLSIVAGVTVVSLLFFAGPHTWDSNFFQNLPKLRDNIRQNIRLGLDLRGGTQLVLHVKTDDAIRAETDQTISSIRTQLQQANINARQLTRANERVNEFTAVVDSAKDEDFRRIMTDTHPEWTIVSASTAEASTTYTIRLQPEPEKLFREQSVDQALNTIRNRVDQQGVTEPVIEKYGAPGDDELLVQFPGVDDPEKVKTIIKKTALLELKLVEGSGSYPSQQAALQQFGGFLPSNLEVLPSVSRNPDGSTAFYVVQKIANVTGRDLKGAFASRDDNGRPAVSFTMTADGARKFGALTGANIGKLLAIILDGRVQSAPVLQSEIRDQGQITGGAGGFAPQEVQDLVLLLRSGALPASIETLDSQVLGPSLGEDSIRAGVLAAIIALGSVVLFVLFYYRGSGINATLAMVMNLLILLGAMAYLGATLTLPGIAGVILTIGVGIDSNVLIFERIREELRAGKTAASAVATSFQRVFITLVDTHLAALISAVFLFLFGTGPVKGFAVTLVIGLISNMFTSVFISRTLFEMVLSRKDRAGALSI